MSEEEPEAGLGADAPIERSADPELLDDPDARAILEALRSAGGEARRAGEGDPAAEPAALDDTTAGQRSGAREAGGEPEPGQRPPAGGVDLSPRFSEG